jgi:hypothetical protein
LLFATTETEAKKRTASGVTVEVPTPVTVMCFELSAAFAGRALYATRPRAKAKADKEAIIFLMGKTYPLFPVF